MQYTVHEVADISGVTIKTLYHYHKIGLLKPDRVEGNGYRYYGEKELKRLQQILFYRELDFSLENIKTALGNEPNRLSCLYEQYSMLKAREQRLKNILISLEETIQQEKKGVNMSGETLFRGLNKKEWEDALKEQNKYLQENYNYDINTAGINADVMNEKAEEAMGFISFMAESLKKGLTPNDKSVIAAIEKHIQFMKKDMDIDAKDFSNQTRFLMTDDFHRNMMEGRQTGLSYYICYAAESYAAQ